MKYDELDLEQFVPFGISLNKADHVIARNAINDFFLKGFQNWYRPLQYYAISCSAPYSLEANNLCDDRILRRFIEEAGIKYYAVDHNTLAEFTKNLYTYPRGTQGIIDAVVKYACNNDDVEGTTVATEIAHIYDINIEGDIVGSSLTEDIVNRLSDNLNNVAPASEKWRGINLTEKDSMDANVGVNATDVAYERHVRLQNTRIAYMNTTKTAVTTNTTLWVSLRPTFPGTGSADAYVIIPEGVDVSQIKLSGCYNTFGNPVAVGVTFQLYDTATISRRLRVKFDKAGLSVARVVYYIE